VRGGYTTKPPRARLIMASSPVQPPDSVRLGAQS
ncbi:uncharacterized protein METZ01_LOCUS158547, partial [marine metagenome]